MTRAFSQPWIPFLSGFGGILLTFLAGAEVDRVILKMKAKESLLIGGITFFAPFLGAIAYCYWIGHWTWHASIIAGIALSTTSLAVIYAVLVETGLTKKEIGKIIMASCFITDPGTALALSLIFAEFNVFTLIFAGCRFLLCSSRRRYRQPYLDGMATESGRAGDQISLSHSLSFHLCGQSWIKPRHPACLCDRTYSF